MSKKQANSLINQTSPYLLQHAYNPVDWEAWSDDIITRAEQENKPILFSIGYSSCHWCHVMERECFEDEEVARVMNERFICVKIDREEHPDIDQTYMDAVTLLTQRGGWPLNCFTLPDGRPFYGGTYFPKAQWMQVLDAVQNEFENNFEELEAFAENLTKGIIQKNSIGVNQLPTLFDNDVLEVMTTRWKRMFDKVDGGLDHAPKFPMPNNYLFLMREGWLNNDNELLNQVDLTLKKMARGGIYDQLEGGFARYSVDGYWRVPHFEKMLYDNAQLIELYCEAYRWNGSTEFASTIRQSIAFCNESLRESNGRYYSALDADSDGREGAYYTFSEAEIRAASGQHFDLIKVFYRVDKEGYWEEGQNILMRNASTDEFCQNHQLTESAFNAILEETNSKLLKLRMSRSKPGLDDKSITSWNAMMISALCSAYDALGDETYLDDARLSASFISDHLIKDGKVFHTYQGGKAKIDGFLEDYATLATSMLSLYMSSGEEQYLKQAQSLIDYTIDHFYDENKEMFYFTHSDSFSTLHRRVETEDGVIPSSNSIMANVLIDMHHLLNEDRYYDIAQAMLHRIQPKMTDYPPSFSNWAMAYQKLVYPYYEIAITGPEAKNLKKELQEHYQPNSLIVFSSKPSKLPLFEMRHSDSESRIFVCVNQQCQAPSRSVEEALKAII